MVNVLWGASAEVELRPTGTNLFIIKFSSSEACDKALELENVPQGIELHSECGGTSFVYGSNYSKSAEIGICEGVHTAIFFAILIRIVLKKQAIAVKVRISKKSDMMETDECESIIGLDEGDKGKNINTPQGIIVPAKGDKDGEAKKAKKIAEKLLRKIKKNNNMGLEEQYLPGQSQAASAEAVRRIKMLDVSQVGLIEIRIKLQKMKEVMDKWFIGWRLFHNYEKATNGRIGLIWKSSLKVDNVATSNRSIIIGITLNDKKFIFTVIYGINSGINRRKLWKHLADLYCYLERGSWILA
ncbi:hypothetical protein DITRI_Ditri14bG0065800 [Diplodiscus trichospermus]